MKKNIIIFSTILLVGVVAWYIYMDLKGVSSDLENAHATTTLKDLGIDFEGEGITVEEVPAEDIKQPSFDRKITFSEAFSVEARQIMTKKFADVITELKKDPTRVDWWMEYASYLNAVSDYDGAREVWEYVKFLAPETPEIYGNLGFLYGYNLKDSIKGEENFILAIKLSPKDPLYYMQTAQFYIDIMKDSNRALFVVDKGLENIPNDKNLLYLQSRLKK